LAFKLKDGNYHEAICISIDQYRGHCDYIFVPTTYNSPVKPTVYLIKDKEILGRRVGSGGYDQQTIIEMQPGIERIWLFEFKDGNGNYFFGAEQLAVDHKDLINFKDAFEKTGTLQVIQGLKNTGSFTYGKDLTDFERMFGDTEAYMKIFNCRKYPIRVVCEV
jgi:hypothetical protein